MKALEACQFSPVVSFDPQQDQLLLLDFTKSNKTLSPEIIEDTTLFTNYVASTIAAAGARYGIGGYNEHRTIYSRSTVFDGNGEERRIHLGIDIWGSAGTPVYAPLNGVVHSFAFNNAFGDYGATLILQHHCNGVQFHTLYGHLSLQSIRDRLEGQEVGEGQRIGSFGDASENGNWPPHLHFQLIIDMKDHRGDYPGVCSLANRESFLFNSPDPDLVLKMMCYARPQRPE